jgi:hypothetical protein
MFRFMSRLRAGTLPRLAAMTLSLGGITTASAQDIEGYGQDQRATVTLPPGGRACLGSVKGTVFLRATGDATGRLTYFMRRSTTDLQGSFTKIPFSDITGARQYDFTVDSDGRPDLFPGFFKVCASNEKDVSVRVDLTLRGE